MLCGPIKSCPVPPSNSETLYDETPLSKSSKASHLIMLVKSCGTVSHSGRMTYPINNASALAVMLIGVLVDVSRCRMIPDTGTGAVKSIKIGGVA